MTVYSALASFAVIAGLLTIIPGLDTALVVRAAVSDGRAAGFATALGINSGTLVWGAAAAVGVSALLAASRLGYDLLRLAGAVYLMVLGTSMLWHSWRRRPAAAPGSGSGSGSGSEAGPGPMLAPGPVLAPGPRPAPGPGPGLAPRPALAAGAGPEAGPGAAGGSAPTAGLSPRDVLRLWLRGLMTNLLNPKVGVFYVAMLPQFIPAHEPHLMMGLALAGVHDVEGLVWFTLLIFAVHRARRWLSNDRAKRIMDRVTGTVLVGFGLKLAFSRT